MQQKIPPNYLRALIRIWILIFLSWGYYFARGWIAQNPTFSSPLSTITSSLDPFSETITPDPEEDPALYLVAGGDIMLSRNIGYLSKLQGYDRIFSGNYHPLSGINNCHGDACLLFFNLESLFSEKDHDVPEGGFEFRANPANIETLLELRQDHPLVLSLANNHTINAHYSGLLQTQALLDQQEIGHVGAGLSPEEAREFFSYEYADINLCFASYSYDGQFIKVGAGKMAWNPLWESSILEDLEKMDILACDAKILSLHRGAEYRLNPSPSQKNLAHRLIDAGADLILGGHSHIPGLIEEYGDRYIVYSLGNFIFDQDWGKWAKKSDYDYSYDTLLERSTVPTYIAPLLAFKITKEGDGTKIGLEQIAMTRTQDGVHSLLDPATYQGMIEKIYPAWLEEHAIDTDI